MSAWLDSGDTSLPGFHLLIGTLHGKERGSSGFYLFIRTLIPSWEFPVITSSKPNYLPKTPPPSVTTLGVSASTYEFWEDINIQSITVTLK